MKILLLYPRVESIKELMTTRPPLGLAYIAASLEKEGHHVKIIDLNLEKETVLKEEVQKHELVGISVLTVFYNKVKELIKKIREVDKKIPIVLGGPHITMMAKKALEETDADFAVIYEGEETITELVKEIETGKKFSKIKGIAYKENGNVKINEDRPFNKNLDGLPLPARHLLKIDKYVSYMENENSTTMLTSRGCPYACVYCCKTEGRTWRATSAKKVADEMEEIHKKYNINVIYIEDDLFTLDKKRVMEICGEIKKRNLKIKWICISRVDMADLEMLKAMKEAGCVEINYGVESGDQEVLDKIGKRITLEQAERAFKITKEAGIQTKGYFIIGLPWDTKETIEKTIDFAIKLNADEIQFSICTPLPGTPLWELAIKEGAIKPNEVNWDNFALMSANIEGKVYFTNKLSAEEIIGLRKKAYRKLIIKTVIRKIMKGDIKAILKTIKQKKRVGLGRFIRKVFLPV